MRCAVVLFNSFVAASIAAVAVSPLDTEPLAIPLLQRITHFWVSVTMIHRLPREAHLCHLPDHRFQRRTVCCLIPQRLLDRLRLLNKRIVGNKFNHIRLAFYIGVPSK